jgi:hypothetical protein
MDKSRRQEPKGWAEREGEGFLQRSKPRKARLEATSTQSEKRKRRWQEEVFLRENDGDAGANEET